MKNLFKTTIGPLLLICLSPPFVILLWQLNTHFNGSVYGLLDYGIFNTIKDVWYPNFFGSTIAWKIIFIFAISQLILMRVMPGKIALGPVTQKGTTPSYKNNGLACFFTSISIFLLGAVVFNWYSLTIIYDNFLEILSALNIFSLFFCLFLYFKGRFFPSSADNSITGNFIFDYYWGTELYPRVFGWDIKQFTNCRFGMMSWGLIIISFAAKQNQIYGISTAMLVSVFLQLFYITKFFIWETGYLQTIDIMHDRAGFYICWGCLVFVPGFYTSPTCYLVHQPLQIPALLAISLACLGVLFIIVNFIADRQRQKIRAYNGKCKIWGKEPVLTSVKYIDDQGNEKDTILLASGFWGLSRHFHYIPEILGALLWSIPAGFNHISPYFYVIFLTILLVHRSIRDECRCMNKYGKGWEEHCAKVPYKIIPFIY